MSEAAGAAPWLPLLAALAGYLAGSIPFGLILTRLAGLGDIRSVGSGNIGATNVLRTGNKKLAAATLVGDMLKGTVAVLVGARFLGGPEAALAAGVGAFLGHLFPVWLGFKGGKGVATFLGTLLALAWPVGIAACLTWLVTAVVSRISSLSALVAATLSVAWAAVFGQGQMIYLVVILATLVFWKHLPNIERLKAGTEPRIGGKG